jgi:hypothetical protein
LRPAASSKCWPITANAGIIRASDPQVGTGCGINLTRKQKTRSPASIPSERLPF